MQRLHFTSRHHGFMLLMSLVVALGTVMLAMPTVAATDARASRTGIVPLDARRCDIDHPQDCIINTPPPFTPVVSPIQTGTIPDTDPGDGLPAARAPQPLRPHGLCLAVARGRGARREFLGADVHEGVHRTIYRGRERCRVRATARTVLR